MSDLHVTSTPDLLVRAETLRRSGQLAEAAQCCRQALTSEPSNAQAHNLLGQVLGAAGHAEQAEACFRQAIACQADYVLAHSNLGVALQMQGKLLEAAAAFRRAIELTPHEAELHRKLAGALEDAGARDEAIAALREAVRLRPDFAEAFSNLGLVLGRQGQLDEAIAAYGRALELEPGRAETRFQYELAAGLTALAARRDDEAAACFRRVIELRPDYAEAYNNLGVTLMLLDQPEEAETWLRRAVELEADYADAHSNLGAAVEMQGASVANGIERSLAAFRRAVELRPRVAKVRHNYGMALLRNENFAEGWKEFEWRLLRDGPGRQFALPRWSGEPLTGKTLLLWEDEGLGDTLQCIRYAPLLQDRGANVIVECRRQLTELLVNSPGIDQVVVAGTPLPKFDVHLPLLSLPGLMGTTLASIPANVPYVFPARALVERWNTAICAVSEFKIGIAWQGNPQHQADRYRSIPLHHFAPLAHVAGVRLYSLQSGAGREQLASSPASPEIVDLGDRLGDFQNTAAIVQKLDLVVTCDSVQAHLAGALGVPVWVALPHVADWRWFVDRTDSPWYPTMRLYRQARRGDWQAVFQRIAADLAAFRA